MPKIRNNSLSLKQSKFVNYYLESGNAKDSAVKSGYSKKSAYAIGSENLTKPLIKEHINNSLASRVSPEWIVDKLKSNAIESGSNEVRQYSASNQALKILADFMTPQTEQTERNVGSLDSVALTESELKKLLEIIDLVGVAALASFIRREMDSIEVIDGEFSEAKIDREI